MTILDAVIGAHIAAGLSAVIGGGAAMFAAKRPGRHPAFGRVYLVALTTLVITGTAIAVTRPHTLYLLLPGWLAACAAGSGYLARRVRWRGWLPHHLCAMTTSYILMLTAFYVDNGPRLPVWKLLPQTFFWFLPAAVGVPLLVWTWRRWTPRRDTPPTVTARRRSRPAAF